MDSSRTLGQPATTVRTIRANADKIKECAQSMAPLTAARITKGRDKVMDNMERLLRVWIKVNGTSCEFGDDTKSRF